MWLSERETTNIRNLKAVVQIDESHPSGTRCYGASQVDRLFYADSTAADKPDCEILTQRWSGGTISVNAGDVVFIPRTLRYEDRVIRPFCSLLIYADFDFQAENRITKWSFGENPEMRQLFRSILQIWERKRAGFYFRCMSVLYEILFLTARREQSGYTSPAKKALLPAVEYMKENLSRGNIEIPHLAQLCKMSYSHFRNRFLDTYGVSAKNYLSQMRLDTAKNLLEISDFSVTEIAERCGFTDVYYFSNFFKKLTGLSPTEYRKRILFSHSDRNNT